MQLPAPLRAVIGLAASVADEARRLPSRAIEFPMLAVSTAVQMSLRAQQRYASLTARGDEVLSRAPSDEPPPWATFDDPVDEPADGKTHHRGHYSDSRRAAQILDDIMGTAGIAHDTADDADAETDTADVPPPTPIRAARKASAARAGSSPKPAQGKRVSKPRNAPVSKFDAADDD